MLFRTVASVAPDYLGQPILIKLMPGGGGAIAADFASKAGPDGYTLLAVEDTRFSEIPHIPTTLEEGIPEASKINMFIRPWRDVMAPKGTPPAIIDKVAMAFKKMTEDKSVIAMIHR